MFAGREIFVAEAVPLISTSQFLSSSTTVSFFLYISVIVTSVRSFLLSSFIVMVHVILLPSSERTPFFDTFGVFLPPL